MDGHDFTRSYHSPSSGISKSPDKTDSFPRTISPEFFNLAIAFLLLTLRYPSVFWYTNRAFSFVFSLLLLLVGIHGLLECSAASILVRLGCNIHLSRKHVWPPDFTLISSPSMNKEHLSSDRSQMNKPVGNEPMQLDDSDPMSENDNIIVEEMASLSMISPLALSTFGTLLFCLLFLAVFEYGYHQFADNLIAYRHYLIGSSSTSGFALLNGDLVTSADTADRSGPNGPNGPVYNPTTVPESIHSGQMSQTKSNFCLSGETNGPRPSRCYSRGAELLHPVCKCCLHTYAAHVCGVGGSLIVLAMKIPLIWDCIQVYRITRHPIMLASTVSGLIVICAWFIAWFAFTLKPAWKFQVNLPLQPVSGTNYPVINMAPNMNYISNTNPFNGHMITSQLRQSNMSYLMNGLNMRSHGPLIGSGPPSLHPQMNVLSPPDGFNPDDGNEQTGVGVPASPIYACFHDRNTGFYGVSASASSIGIPLSSQMVVNQDAAGNVVHISGNVANGVAHQNGPSQDSRNMEYCSEDIEAGSRQSGGNNYVCLQSALNSSNCPNVGQTVLIGNEANGLVTRFIHATSPSPTPPLISPQQAQFPTLNIYSGRLPNVSASGLNLATPTMANRVGLEEDENSTGTVQGLGQRKSFGQPGNSYVVSGSTLTRLPNSNNFLSSNRFANSASTSDRSQNSEDPNYASRTYPNISLSATLNSLNGTLRPSNTGLILNSSPTTVATAAPSNNSASGPRVTFRDNTTPVPNPTMTCNTNLSHSSSATNQGAIDEQRKQENGYCEIPGGGTGATVGTTTNISPNNNKANNNGGSSSNTSAASTSSTSSNSSKPDSTTNNNNNNSSNTNNNVVQFGSGPYDNAFPATFRSSLVIKGPSQTPNSSSLKDPNSGDQSNSSIMTSSLFAARHGINQSTGSKIPNNTNGASSSRSDSSSNQGGAVQGTGVMIGDTFANMQPGAIEDFPMLLSSHLLSDEVQEPRLCSQV